MMTSRFLLLCTATAGAAYCRSDALACQQDSLYQWILGKSWSEEGLPLFAQLTCHVYRLLRQPDACTGRILHPQWTYGIRQRTLSPTLLHPRRSQEERGMLKGGE